MIINTKLEIPQTRNGFVARARLYDLLETEDIIKLILICSPAGYGKTTLLSSWAEKRPESVAWFSLDEDDNDPAQFWQYVITALQHNLPEFGKNLRPAFSSKGDFGKAFLVLLINELQTVRNICYIVLDDFHLINNPLIHNAVDFLLDNLPSRIKMVISTRTYPPVKLNQLRVKNHLKEILTTDMIFSVKESGAFLRHCMKLNIQDDGVKILHKNTEGWIAGLQIAALSFKQKPDIASIAPKFSGNHAHVMGYFIDEVFSHLSSETRSFLLKTSVLKDLSAPLCHGVTENNHSGSILADLEKNNLFIAALDDGRTWYRYHSLFAKAMRNRLHETDPAQIPLLYEKASLWHEKAGHLDEAIYYAFAIKNEERVVHLIKKQSLNAVHLCETAKTRNWLNRLSEDTINSAPVLCLLYAWAFQIFKDPYREQIINRLLRSTEYQLSQKTAKNDSSKKSAPKAYQRVKSFLALVRLYRSYERGESPDIFEEKLNNFSPAFDDEPFIKCIYYLFKAVNQLQVDHFEKAKEYIQKAENHSRENLIPHAVAMIFFLKFWIMFFYEGRIQDALDAGTHATKILSGCAGPRNKVFPCFGRVYISLAAIYYEKNDLQAAENFLNKGLRLVNKEEEPYLSVIALAQTACLKMVTGKPQSEVTNSIKAVNSAEQIRPGAKMLSAALHIRFLIFTGSDEPNLLNKAQEIAVRHGINLERSTDYPKHYILNRWHRSAKLILVRLRICQARIKRKFSNNHRQFMQPVFDFLDHQNQYARSKQWTRLSIEILILTALAHDAVDDPDAALNHMDQAMILAEPEGHVRLFADEGEPVTILIGRLLSQGKHLEYGAALMAAVNCCSKKAVNTLVEQLTGREKEVIRLITGGLSNKKIASTLNVSISTIKTHTNNIYGKLGVNNRTSAVDIYRRSGRV